VYVVHGTRKFLDRVGEPTRTEVGDPTTVLGDWYATVLFWKRQVGLFVNESTLLPVLMPFALVATVIDRFPAALATVLRRHGIGDAFHRARVRGDGRPPPRHEEERERCRHHDRVRIPGRRLR